MPGKGARTKVSGVSRKWSRWLLLRVCPRLCMRILSGPDQPAPALRLDGSIGENDFPPADRFSNHAPQPAANIRTGAVAMNERLLRDFKVPIGIDQRHIGMAAGLDRSFHPEIEPPRAIGCGRC